MGFPAFPNVSKQALSFKPHIVDIDVNKKVKSKHMMKKLKKRPPTFHKCDKCKYSTTSSARYKRHILKHSKRFKCDQCDYITNKRYNLKQHKYVHSGNRPNRPKPFKCDYEDIPGKECNKSFSSRIDLKNHINAHLGLKPFKCDYKDCNKSFSIKRSLKQHQYRIHSGIKPFFCTICKKRFSAKPSLKVHFKKHSGVRPFECDHILCIAKFFTKSSLERHKKTVHSEERPFPCSLCPKKFKEKNKLKEHTKRHQNDKKYQCHICLKKFVTKAEASRHAEKIHYAALPKLI